MKTLSTLFASLLMGAVLLAGCSNDEAGGTADGSAATQSSKQGSTQAQAGELQPPPNAPNPDAIMGSRAGGG